MLIGNPIFYSEDKPYISFSDKYATYLEDEIYSGYKKLSKEERKNLQEDFKKAITKRLK